MKKYEIKNVTGPNLLEEIFDYDLVPNDSRNYRIAMIEARR